TATAIHNPTIPTRTGPTRSLCSGNATRITCFIHPKLPVSCTTNTAAAAAATTTTTSTSSKFRCHTGHGSWILISYKQVSDTSFFRDLYPSIAFFIRFAGVHHNQKWGLGNLFSSRTHAERLRRWMFITTHYDPTQIILRRSFNCFQFSTFS